MKCSLLLFALLFIGSGVATAQDVPRPTGPPVPLTGVDDGTFAQPVWSPDGRWIALTGPRHSGLWLATPDGQTVRRLSEEDAAADVTWSPDGSALLARVARSDGPRRELAAAVFDVETDERRFVTDFRASMPALPRWSADGSRVLLYAGNQLERIDSGRPPMDIGKRAGAHTYLAADGDLAIVSGDLIERAVPFEQPVLNVTPSPDGSKVAFEVLGGSLYVMEADGSGLVDLGRGYYRPSWSPDGRWLVVMQTQDDGHEYTAADLVALRSDGQQRVALTETPDRLEMSPSWSPDGSRIAFEQHDEGAVYVLPVAW